MAAPLSEDLRIRVIRSVVENGLSYHAAARRFEVSANCVMLWVREYRRSGRTHAKPCGGDRRSGRIEAQAEFLLSAIEKDPGLTLAELRQRLVDERGERFAISTVHEFFRRHGVTYKKRRRTPANNNGKT